jgi:hypothetical protein
MNRCLAFLLAIAFAAVTISSACVAAPSDWIHFTLEPERGASGKIQASFGDQSRGRGENSWSSGFPASQLIGLDLAGFRGSGNRPLRFAIVREAGRLDCAGNGGNAHAAGNCAFTADLGFTQLIVSRGIPRPTRREAFGLIALDVRRDIIDAVGAARYPTPDIDDLMAMTAVGVDGRYISGLARAGYRPHSIDTLVQFRALNITPEWIGGFARAGYPSIAADELVQLRALDITPEFIAGFDRLGYRGLPVDTLVQLKALNITPEFARTAERQRGVMPPVSELVQQKIFGKRR